MNERIKCTLKLTAKDINCAARESKDAIIFFLKEGSALFFGGIVFFLPLIIGLLIPPLYINSVHGFDTPQGNILVTIFIPLSILVEGLWILLLKNYLECEQ